MSNREANRRAKRDADPPYNARRMAQNRAAAKAYRERKLAAIEEARRVFAHDFAVSLASSEANDVVIDMDWADR